MALTESEELELLELEEQELASQSQPSQTPPSESFMDTVGQAAGKIQGTMPYVAGLMSPTLGLGYKAAEQMNEASGELGGNVAEMLGRETNLPHPVNALVGMGATILSNPQTYVNPGSGMSGRLMKPVAPLERQAAVGVAERIGMPLRRGEVTGSKASLGLSNLMEKTVMGAGPEDAFTKNQYSALGAEKSRIQNSIGNPGDIYAVGSNAQSKIKNRGAGMKSARDAMFEAIPDDVVIPLTEYARHGDDVIAKQSKVRPITRNPEVTKFAQDAQTPYQSTGQGVTGGPDKFGETLSVSPETKFSPKSNYFEVKELRETLNAKITEAEKAGNGKAYREFTQMKKALDSDIENFANSEVSPLDSMMAKEFKQSYRKANAFHGAYKGLFGSDEAKALLDADPNKVVDMVFKGKNNETAIKQFRALSGEEGFLPAKQTFTKELLDSPNITKELAKYEEGHLRSIYSAQELKELSDYGLAQSLPKTTSNLQGTSGSSRSNIGAGQYTGLGMGILSLLSGNVAGAAAGIGQFLAPAVVSRANLAMSRGIPASLGKASMNTMKTLGIYGNSRKSMRSIITQFVENRIHEDNQ